MEQLQIAHIRIDVTDSGIVIADSSDSEPGKVVIPLDKIGDVIEFLTHHANRVQVQKRRSFRLTLEPGEIAAWITTASQKVAVVPLDISLGGALLGIEEKLATPLDRGDVLEVRFDLDGTVAHLNSEVVRTAVGQLAVRFVDCDVDGSLSPTTDLMRLYSDIQRRWLAKRFKT